VPGGEGGGLWEDVIESAYNIIRACMDNGVGVTSTRVPVLEYLGFYVLEYSGRDEKIGKLLVAKQGIGG